MASADVALREGHLSLSNRHNPQLTVNSPAGEGQPWRAARACDSCHQKKIKCDGIMPRCNWCEHHAIDCTHHRKRGGKRRENRSRKLMISNLEQRMERIEQRLLRNIKGVNSVYYKPNKGKHSHAPTETTNLTLREPQQEPKTLGPEPVKKKGANSSAPGLAAVSRLYCAGYKLGDVSLFHGVPFLSHGSHRWIGFKIEENDSPGPLWQNDGNPWPSMSSAGDLLLEKPADLPGRDILQPYLEAYYVSPFRHAFPLVDPMLFPVIIEKAYKHDITNSRAFLASRACVFAFLALTSLFCDEGHNALPPIDLKECITAAKVIIPDTLNAQPSTEAVDAMAMLALCEFGCGNIQSLDVLLSVITRFLFMLAAHLYPGEESDTLPTELQNVETRTVLHRRDVFWVCYSLDREITFRTGRPPIINDNSCDLTFPKYYLRQIDPEFTGVWRLPGDLRLSLIKSKTYEKLYSPRSLQKSDAEILKDIRELDDLLENWRQSLRPKIRPSLLYSEEAERSPDDANTDVSRCMLRLEYHHCVTTIHQASSRCKTLAGDQRVDQGLRSSLDLALGASRSLLSYFHADKKHMIPSLFWVIIFYTLSAKLTLLCNILLNPSTSAASNDLRLLERILESLKAYLGSSRRLSNTQLLHLKATVDLDNEVVELAKSIILEGRIEAR